MLTAVNLAEFRVTTSVPVSAQPGHVLVRPGARQLYVVSATGKITVAAFPRLRLVNTLDVGGSAHDLQFSPDGRAAYVLDPAGHEVVFLECGGDAGDHGESAVPKVVYRLRLPGNLRDLALSSDGKTLVAASENPNLITFIDTKTSKTLGTTEVGQSPGPMVILPDNSKVFVADSGEAKISVSALSPQKLFSHIEIGTRPTALLLKPDGGEIFVLAAQSSTLSILDAFHDNVEGTFPLGGNPVAGVFRRDMSVLYVANAGDGSVLALDGQTREVIASTHVGMAPCALALTPDVDQRLLVVADRAASSLAILQADRASLTNDRSVLITTIQVGASPVDVVVPDNINPR
jgi:YVTN family beta-propeller protein